MSEAEQNAHNYGSSLYKALTLSRDLQTEVKGLSARALVGLAQFVKAQAHNKGVVGLVRSIVELEMARRWFEENKVSTQPSGNTAAEGLDSANPMKAEIVNGE